MPDPPTPQEWDTPLPLDLEDDGRHAPIPQNGCNVCVCGELVGDTSAHS